MAGIIDYSRFDENILPPLDERGLLNENTGVGGTAEVGDYQTYRWCFFDPPGEWFVSGTGKTIAG
jgi:hypothetical protein